MLAQLTPDILKALPNIGAYGYLFAFLLYGIYLLVNRSLTQQEGDRKLLLDMLIAEIEQNKKTDIEQAVLLQAISTALTVIDSKTECIAKRISKLGRARLANVKQLDELLRVYKELREELK